MGLDPTTPGSRPEPKADAQPLCHPGAPEDTFLNVKISGKDNKINDISVKRRMGKLEWESGFLIWGMLSFSDTV